MTTRMKFRGGYEARVLVEARVAVKGELHDLLCELLCELLHC